MTLFPYSRSTALVTGASRGIGAALARLLAERGVRHLVLTARTQKDLEALAQEIEQKHKTAVTTIAADLGEADAPDALFAAVQERGLSIDLLVNNAGFGSLGPFHERERSREEGMIAVNVTALVKLTHLFLPGMYERGWGGIIQVASTAAFQPVPYMSVYGATKAFVLSFSEGLWAEAEDRGADVRVVCLCPGGTKTDFDFGQNTGGGRRGKFEEMPQDTPEAVAKTGLDALDKGQMTAVVGPMNQIGTLGARFLPRASVARVARAMFRPPSVTPLPAAKHLAPPWKIMAFAAAGAAAVTAAVAVYSRGASKERGVWK